jgi:hypothetical protein
LRIFIYLFYLFLFVCFTARNMSARAGPAFKRASAFTNTAGFFHKVVAGGLVLLAASSFIGLISLTADLKFGKTKV